MIQAIEWGGKKNHKLSGSMMATFSLFSILSSGKRLLPAKAIVGGAYTCLILFFEYIFFPLDLFVLKTCLLWVPNHPPAGSHVLFCMSCRLHTVRSTIKCKLIVSNFSNSHMGGVNHAGVKSSQQRQLQRCLYLRESRISRTKERSCVTVFGWLGLIFRHSVNQHMGQIRFVLSNTPFSGNHLLHHKEENFIYCNQENQNFCPTSIHSNFLHFKSITSLLWFTCSHSHSLLV